MANNKGRRPNRSAPNVKEWASQNKAKSAVYRSMWKAQVAATKAANMAKASADNMRKMIDEVDKLIEASPTGAAEDLQEIG